MQRRAWRGIGGDEKRGALEQKGIALIGRGCEKTCTVCKGFAQRCIVWDLHCEEMIGFGKVRFGKAKALCGAAAHWKRFAPMCDGEEKHSHEKLWNGNKE